MFVYTLRIIHETNGFSKEQLQLRRMETIIPFQYLGIFFLFLLYGYTTFVKGKWTRKKENRLTVKNE